MRIQDAFLESRTIYQKSYRQFIEPVRKKYELTNAELDILLFLANNPSYDTAKDIVEYRGLVKSHVSDAVSKLEEKAYIKKEYRDGNHKTVHLVIGEPAFSIVEEGKARQKEYIEVLHEGISEAELELVQKVMDKMTENIRKM